MILYCGTSNSQINVNINPSCKVSRYKYVTFGDRGVPLSHAGATEASKRVTSQICKLLGSMTSRAFTSCISWLYI